MCHGCRSICVLWLPINLMGIPTLRLFFVITWGDPRLPSIEVIIDIRNPWVNMAPMLRYD